MFLTIVKQYNFTRNILLSVVISLFSLEPAISQDVDPETTDYTTETIMIRVEESVSLATDIYYPGHDGPFPSILIRTRFILLLNQPKNIERIYLYLIELFSLIHS